MTGCMDFIFKQTFKHYSVLCVLTMLYGSIIIGGSTELLIFLGMSSCICICGTERALASAVSGFSFTAPAFSPSLVTAVFLPSPPPVVNVFSPLSSPALCFALAAAKIISISSWIFIVCSLATFSRSIRAPPAKVVLRGFFLPADVGSSSSYSL